MKFDLIISNPPYNHNLDLKIMKEIYELSDRFCFVHPAGWLYDKKGNKLYDSIKEMLSNDFADYELINSEKGNKLFGIGLYYDIVVDLFEKGNKQHDIYGIDLHGNSENFKAIKQKIINYCQNNNDMGCMSENYKYIKFDIGLHNFRGNAGTPDLNTVIELSKPEKHIFESKKSTHSHRYSFETKQEQENFLNYLRSKMFRFCLSLRKINQHTYVAELNWTPYLPTYRHNWTDEMIAKEIGLTHEEMIWMINWIPDYYPGDEEKYEKYFDPNQTERQLLNAKYTYGGYKV